MSAKTLILIGLVATAAVGLDLSKTDRESLEINDAPYYGELVGLTYNYGDKGEKNWIWRASPYDLPETYVKTAPFHDAFQAEGFALDGTARRFYVLKYQHIDVYDSDVLNRLGGMFLDPTPATIEVDSKTGTLYGLRMSGGVWIDSIDVETEVRTPVYQLPDDTAYYMDGSAFDPDTGRMFLAVERLSEQEPNEYTYIIHLNEEEPYHEAIGPFGHTALSLSYNRVTKELIGFGKLLNPEGEGWGSIIALTPEGEWRDLYGYGRGFPGNMQSAVDGDGNLVIILDYYGEDTMYVIDAVSGEVLDKKEMVHELTKFAWQPLA